MLQKIASNEPSTRIFPGSGTFRFALNSNHSAAEIRVRYHLPSRLPKSSPVLFVMHGTGRNAAEYRNNWAFAAEEHGFLLLCPEFPIKGYSRKAYQLGGLIDDSGNWLSGRAWTFGVIETLFDFVRHETGNTGERYYLYGHSAGGQFVHRMALAMPRARFAAAVAANTGWYTMPTFDGREFPYSLKSSGFSGPGLKKAFGRRLTVLLGEEDTDTEDPTLRKSKAAKEQGANRLERGHAFYATAQNEAAWLGTELNWTLRTVPGAAHCDPHMMPAAARMFFGREA